MSERIEGTVVLDGLLEGRVSDASETPAKLADWKRFAASLGLRFSLEIDGASFSFLAENRPVAVDALSGTPADIVANSLNELLKIFPAEERRSFFSTIRSIEYRKGIEVQTIYVIGPDGLIRTRERTVEAKTTEAPKPTAPRQRLMLAGIGLAVAVAVLLLSSFVVPYRAFFRSLVEGITPVSAEGLTVETVRFDKYFAVTKKEIGPGGKVLVLTVKRTGAFPREDADFEKLAESEKSLFGRLTVEALAKGYLRVEYFDKDNQLISFAYLRISGLRQKETAELLIPLPTERRAVRIVLTY